MKKVKVIYASLFQLQRIVKFQQGHSCICFKVPQRMVKIEEQMTIFDFRLQISDFRFANKLNNQ